MKYTNENYKYELDEYGNAAILEYTRDEEYVSINRIDGHPVTVIKDFGWCRNVKEIHLPETLIMIENIAFQGCRSLVRIDLPDSLKMIDGNPFFGGDHLREFNLSPEHSFFRVENGALISKEDQRLIYVAGRDKTKIYHVPKGVKILGYSAFENYESLEEIVLPDSMVAIEEGALRDCKRLMRINFPNNLTDIGQHPFSHNHDMKEIKISEDHPAFRFDHDALISKKDKRLICFLPAKEVEAYSIPEGINNISEGAFNQVDHTHLQQLPKFQSPKNIWLPDSMININDSAFWGCRSLVSIDLPKSLISIGEYAFGECQSLKEICLPDSVISLGRNAFSYCSSLERINIPDQLIKIDGNPFKGCRILKEISISPDHPAFCIKNGALISKKDKRLISCLAGADAEIYSVSYGIEIIGKDAFSGHKSLKNIKLPDTLISIEDRAFSDCRSLEEIHLPESLSRIGDDSFSSCRALKCINFPKSLMRIGSSAFYGCRRLDHVILPNTLTTIEYGAFLCCTALKDLHLPKELKCIQTDAFGLCNSLEHVHLPDPLIHIEDGAFERCENLKSVNMPESLVEIGDRVFYGCEALKDIHLPESLKMIGEWAFYGCRSLTEINIPESLEFIGEEAFGQCSRLKKLKISKDHWLYDKIKNKILTKK